MDHVARRHNDLDIKRYTEMAKINGHLKNY